MNGRLRVVEVAERGSHIFSRADLYDGNGLSLVLPKTAALRALELRDCSPGVEARICGLVGYLPLTSDIALNVRPKFPIENLWVMLSHSDEQFERILPDLRSYASGGEAPPGLLLLRAFCHYLERILAGGFAKRFLPLRHEGIYVPKVSFPRTVARYASRGDDIHVSSDAFRFSGNVRINRLLKAGCIHALAHLPLSWREERIVAGEAINALSAVDPAFDFSESDLRFGEAGEGWSLYMGALICYGALLGKGRIGFSFELGETGLHLPSFLFLLDEIFESFIRNCARKKLESNSIRVLDGNKTRHQARLFRDNQRFPIKPDLIFKRGEEIIGLCEVKYKPRITEEDRYQLISHVVASGAPFGVFVSPCVGSELTGLEYVGAIRSGERIYRYRFNLDASPIIEIEKMVEEFLILLRGR